MPDKPLVVRLLEQYRADLLIAEAVQFDAMADRWISLERALAGNIDALTFEIAQMQAAGQVVTQSRLIALDQYRTLLAQAQSQFDNYSAYAAGEIASRQGAWGAIGIEAAQAAIQAVAIEAGGTLAAIKVLPVGAIQAMIGLAGDGTPLALLLQQKFPLVAGQISQALINATAMGMNPRQTAIILRDALGIGLDYALLLARTEQLRAYREANRMQMQASGVVSGYRRLADKSTRTCVACLFADGRLYDLDEPLDEHPNGRCSLVPNVIGFPQVNWQSGLSWFEDQPDSIQREMMGAGHYNAWQDGYFELPDMVGVRRNEIWGNALTPKALKDLLSAR